MLKNIGNLGFEGGFLGVDFFRWVREGLFFVIIRIKFVFFFKGKGV